MRNALADELTQLAKDDSRIVLLSGDIGNRLFNPFKEHFPNRFLNCGVAEANMTGVAAGMAMCGLRPITYTITPFATTRCLEQIRVDICYHNVPVVIVGVGAGLSYASLGATHHSCEDIAFLRALPNMTVLCPIDAVELRLCLREAIKLGRPVYIRIGKKNEPVIYETPPSLEIGKGITVQPGDDLCMIVTGNIFPTARAAAELLAAKNISARLVSMHTVKPLDKDLLNEVFKRYPLVVTVEEHSSISGLGGAVAEWVCDNNATGAKLLRFGTQDRFIHESGSQDHLRSLYGLTPENISSGILSTMENIGK